MWSAEPQKQNHRHMSLDVPGWPEAKDTRSGPGLAWQEGVA